MSTKNIYQRVNAVMKEVEYVQKDATISGAGSYKAVTHDNVTAVLRPQLVNNGIVVVVSQVKGKIAQLRDTNAGIKQHLYVGTYEISFVSVDNAEDRITVIQQAHANDSGDKAPGKAESYAVKYAMLKTFSLETGENEEGRYSEPYSGEQLEIFHELLDTDKEYEFYIFAKSLTEEALNGLYNSFPDGKIMQGKKKASAFMENGEALFKNMVEDVQARLANKDISVTEITDEMDITAKRMLAARLSDFEKNQLMKIKEAQQ